MRVICPRVTDVSDTCGSDYARSFENVHLHTRMNMRTYKIRCQKVEYTGPISIAPNLQSLDYHAKDI